MSPLLEEKLLELDDETKRRRAGLLAAKGLIAEAEALSEDINWLADDPYQMVTCPCVTSHRHGGVYVCVIVFSRLADVRRAIDKLGLTVSLETVCDYDKTRPKIHLNGFDVTLDVTRAAVLKEAA